MSKTLVFIYAITLVLSLFLVSCNDSESKNNMIDSTHICNFDSDCHSLPCGPVTTGRCIEYGCECVF
ncbi:unnamed protein product [Trifolium pratense]|uniref:Uncharacterized protein n=1 Tax=Trifolium pratense TaxID=57577 RepID=A0ACB0KR78_TRIPR|nr:unnamed protein product [Trifolium pratense]